jgi:proteic killer suppression protein
VITRVEVSRLASKQLRKAPRHVVDKLFAWARDVADRGLEAVRKVPGYHDEPLKGALEGKRSIRLSLKWRANYVIRSAAEAQVLVEFVEVEEVRPHDY